MKEYSLWNVSNNTYGRANQAVGCIFKYLSFLVFNRSKYFVKKAVASEQQGSRLVWFVYILEIAVCSTHLYQVRKIYPCHTTHWVCIFYLIFPYTLNILTVHINYHIYDSSINPSIKRVLCKQYIYSQQSVEMVLVYIS